MLNSFPSKQERNIIKKIHHNCFYSSYKTTEKNITAVYGVPSDLM